MNTSTVKDYKLGETLGQGGTSVVLKASRITWEDSKTGEQCAVKLLPIDRNTSQSAVKKQVLTEVLSQGHIAPHENILSVLDYDVCTNIRDPDHSDQKVGMIVTELAEHGSLFEYIQVGGGLSEEMTRAYARQLLSAIQHIHAHDIAHRDIKLENLLLGKDFKVKVADFGLALPISGSDGSGFETALYGGTPCYMAPELLIRYPYNPQGADLFALGVTLFVLRTGKMPFNKATMDDPFYKQLAGMNHATFWARHDVGGGNRCSDELKDLLSAMLSLQPFMRPQLADVAGHPWLQKQAATQAQVAQEMAQRHKEIVAAQCPSSQ